MMNTTRVTFTTQNVLLDSLGNPFLNTSLLIDRNHHLDLLTLRCCHQLCYQKDQ